jgi:hypothetical protein
MARSASIFGRRDASMPLVDGKVDKKGGNIKRIQRTLTGLGSRTYAGSGTLRYTW